MKDDELMVVAKTIVGAMTNNIHYPEPIPTLEATVNLLNDFVDKLSVSRKRGSPEDTALKNESRILLMDILQKLAYHVNLISNGHLSTLLSSGFPTTNQSSANLVPLAVKNVRVRDGRQSGQVRLDFAKDSGILIYEYRYRDLSLDEEEWSDRYMTTTSRANIIAPLKVGQYYEVQVRAVNSQGPGDWSNTVRILVR